MPPTSRPRIPKTSERVARDLADQIVGAGLPDGSMLPPEREMTASLGVGRTTLREALRLLESRGALTIKAGPRGGPVVRHPSPRDLGQALTMMLQFELATAGDLIAARLALEPAVARAAAEAIDRDGIEGLRAANAELAALVDDDAGFVRANRRFHEELAAACGNLVLEMFTRSLMTIADGWAMRARLSARARRQVVAAHGAIVDALAVGDADAAERAMRSHIEEAVRHWQRRHPEILSRPVRWEV